MVRHLSLGDVATRYAVVLGVILALHTLGAEARRKGDLQAKQPDQPDFYDGESRVCFMCASCKILDIQFLLAPASTSRI